MLKSFFGWLHDWQELIAGVIAIPATFLTIGWLHYQSRSDRRRKLRASRAMMPAALSLVSDYARACINWLLGVRKPLEALERGIEPEGNELPGLPPEPDPRVFDILKDCVEHADDGPAKAIADLLSAMQVFRSRVTGIGDRVIRHKTYRGGRVLMNSEVNRQIIDAVRLRAMTDRLFPFARMIKDETPEPLDLEAVAAAFKVFDLNEFQEADVWNGLTDLYMSKH